MTAEQHRSPLLCTPAEKPAIEGRNGLAQLAYIVHLVNELGVKQIRESHVLELQRLAVEGIYPCAGTYRNPTRDVQITPGEDGQRHIPPEPALVQGHVRDALDCINDQNRSGLERAAYALWRFNWIHPFSGGNGRTSRAVCYLVLCIDMGMMLPGVPTVPRLIYESREEYVRALKAADKGVREGGEPDLQPMTEYLSDIVTRQLASAIDKLRQKGGGGPPPGSGSPI
jgi:Fic family protein